MSRSVIDGGPRRYECGCVGEVDLANDRVTFESCADPEHLARHGRTWQDLAEKLNTPYAWVSGAGVESGARMPCGCYWLIREDGVLNVYPCGIPQHELVLESIARDFAREEGVPLRTEEPN